MLRISFKIMRVCGAGERGGWRCRPNVPGHAQAGCAQGFTALSSLLLHMLGDFHNNMLAKSNQNMDIPLNSSIMRGWKRQVYGTVCVCVCGLMLCLVLIQVAALEQKHSFKNDFVAGVSNALT